MIPINGHVLIEPVEYESFIASQKETYEEIGIVIDLGFPEYEYTNTGLMPVHGPRKGDKVYFDSWLAAKYPKGGGGHYWLVPFSSIKAYEPKE